MASSLLWDWDVSILEDFFLKSCCRLEAATDDVVELLHWFDRLPQTGVLTNTGWELVAMTRSSNSGYGSRQFRPVVICDRNALDDPFWPSHVSVVYNVEVRERSDIWTTIIIWRVSLLNGGQKKMYEFDITYPNPDWLVHERNCGRCVKCFQSGGVIFVVFGKCLLIYDARYDIPHLYEFGGERSCWCFAALIVSVSCCRRIWSGEGDEVPTGWVVQLLTAESRREAHDAAGVGHHRPLRVVLYNTICDLRLDGDSISIKEEIIFGRFHRRPRLRPVRTTRAVGVHAGQRGITGGPTMLFDWITKNFVYCSNFDKLRHVDGQFAKYIRTATPTEEHDDADVLRPVFQSDRECVVCFEDGAVYRYAFAPPTLKFLAANSLFRSNPDLRIRMSASEFQHMTGIEDMRAHFSE